MTSATFLLMGMFLKGYIGIERCMGIM
jgi:hypothetical protein